MCFKGKCLNIILKKDNLLKYIFPCRSVISSRTANTIVVFVWIKQHPPFFHCRVELFVFSFHLILLSAVRNKKFLQCFLFFFHFRSFNTVAWAISLGLFSSVYTRNVIVINWQFNKLFIFLRFIHFLK